MPTLDCGIAGPGGGSNSPGFGAWTEEVYLDFRALAAKSFVAADVGSGRITHDGHEWEVFGITGGDTIDIGVATYGQDGSAASGTLAWYPSQATSDPIDLTGKQQIAIVCQVWEANPWSGQAGIQVGNAAAGSFNNGADALRTGSTSVQGARRTTGASTDTATQNVPSPAGPTTMLLTISRSAMSCRYRTDIGIGDPLPDPDDAGWDDTTRRPGTGLTIGDDNGQDWESLTNFHVSFWHSGHNPSGRYYGCRDLKIFSSDLHS